MERGQGERLVASYHQTTQKKEKWSEREQRSR
jgi:hypothetical protein